jgi:hypothetical protein
MPGSRALTALAGTIARQCHLEDSPGFDVAVAVAPVHGLQRIHRDDAAIGVVDGALALARHVIGRVAILAITHSVDHEIATVM